MARFIAFPIVLGLLIASVGTIYSRDWLGWNSQGLPPGEHVQVLSLVGGGLLVAFGFILTATDFRWPRRLLARSPRLPSKWR